MTTKKRVLSGLFALALLATTAVGIAESKKGEATMSDLAMANVEALANIEWGSDPDVGTFCDLSCVGGGYCWAIRFTWNLPCERTGYPYHFCKC